MIDRGNIKLGETVVTNTLVSTLDPHLRGALAEARKHVRLVSPFIGGDTALWTSALAKQSAAEWQLLTCLDPVAAAYGSLHLPGLRNLLKAGVNIRHLDRLHAKMFLTEHAGFVGSANLTATGLGGIGHANHELTVELSAEQCAQATAIYEHWYDAAQPVTPAMILACERQAGEIPARISRRPNLRRTEAAKADVGDALLRRSADVTVWIKAIYRDEVTADEPWGDHSWISGARRPSFAVGDLVVIYAVWAKACNAVLRIEKEAVHDASRVLDAGYSEDNAERWPWVSEVSCELQIPISRGVPLTELGLTGQSLQGGHCRMPVGGLAAALRHML